MYLPRRRKAPRSGLSLMEVLAALAIFLLSFVAIGGLITLASERALDVQHLTLATQMCQSKLNEVLCGAIPLQSQSGAMEEDPDWNWSLEASQEESITGLWNVQVRVSREFVGGREISVSMNAMMLDPSLRGNASDKPTVTGEDAATTGSASSSSTSSSSSSSTTGGSGGAPTTPPTGGVR